MLPIWGEQGFLMPVPGKAGDRGFMGAHGEIYALTSPILYTVSAEDLKNVPCFFTLSEITNVPSFPEGHTLYDFFFAKGLPDTLPKVYAIPHRTFLIYPEDIACWYATGYYVTWSKRGCEILDCVLFPRFNGDGPGLTYFGTVWGDMFFVLPPCKPLRSCENRVTFKENIIIFRPANAEAPNPFKAFQKK